jgi:hypothetical protein
MPPDWEEIVDSPEIDLSGSHCAECSDCEDVVELDEAWILETDRVVCNHCWEKFNTKSFATAIAYAGFQQAREIR